MGTTLVAKANTGAGLDSLAGVTTPDGFAAAVKVVDAAGADLLVATAALQSTANTALALLHTDLIAPLPAGTNAIGAITNTSFQVSNFPATQAISAVTLPLQSDVTISGSLIALNSVLIISSNGAGTVIATIAGTWVGTIIFEGSNDTFVTSQAIVATNLSAVAPFAASTTINGAFSIICAGYKQVQCRMSAYTSGTATIVMNASAAERIIVPLQGNPANLQMTATQGPAGATAWPVTMATVPTGAATDATALIGNAQRDTLVNTGVALTGQAGGDYDGVDILTQLLDAGTGEAISTRLVNAPRQDATGAQFVSTSNVVGTPAANNPYVIAGVDGSNIIRRIATDINGNVSTISNVLAPLTNQRGQAIVKQAPTASGEPSIIELLQQINAASIASTHLLTQLVALMRGQNDPPLGEDADSLIGDIIDQRFPFNNLAIN